MDKSEMVEKIFQTLLGSTFENWHKGTFEDFVLGEEGCKTKEQIKKDISRLFNLEERA
jgi:hypothetical protein